MVKIINGQNTAKSYKTTHFSNGPMIPLFTLGKCKTKAGYTAKLLKSGKLNLTKVQQEFEVILQTPIVLVIRIEQVEIIVHQYAELFFKNCADVALMEKLAAKVYKVGLEKV
ncbi:MAG: hypothetical protein QT02_C0002G0067 [archaeon GW2011_AR9]|nr:MAG: hypothetical protein QT02_C0002G0067 [archaeon GW2011_AR9]